MDKITSVQNTNVKHWKKLSTKKERNKTHTYLLDGRHLIDEAIKAHVEIVSIAVTNEFARAHEDILTLDTLVYEVTDEIMRSITDTVSPQGVVAEVKIPRADEIDHSTDLINGAWLMLDNVQDPGNIGTMVRTADAAGYQGVIASNNTADFYSPKVVRSMQGSQFHLQLIRGDLIQWIARMKDSGMPVYGSKLDEHAQSYTDISPADHFALVMGNEGNGMTDEILGQTSKNLYIPMGGRAESLNVAIAAGILMFHLLKIS